MESRKELLKKTETRNAELTHRFRIVKLEQRIAPARPCTYHAGPGRPVWYPC